MKTIERVEKTINLPKDLFDKASDLGFDEDFSDLVETALRALIKNTKRIERDHRELSSINLNATALNEEALDVLEYQQVNW